MFPTHPTRRSCMAPCPHSLHLPANTPLNPNIIYQKPCLAIPFTWFPKTATNLQNQRSILQKTASALENSTQHLKSAPSPRKTVPTSEKHTQLRVMLNLFQHLADSGLGYGFWEIFKLTVDFLIIVL